MLHDVGITLSFLNGGHLVFLGFQNLKMPSIPANNEGHACAVGRDTLKK